MLRFPAARSCSRLSLRGGSASGIVSSGRKRKTGPPFEFPRSVLAQVFTRTYTCTSVRRRHNTAQNHHRSKIENRRSKVTSSGTAIRGSSISNEMIQPMRKEKKMKTRGRVESQLSLQLAMQASQEPSAKSCRKPRFPRSAGMSQEKLNSLLLQRTHSPVNADEDHRSSGARLAHPTLHPVSAGGEPISRIGPRPWSCPWSPSASGSSPPASRP